MEEIVKIICLFDKERVHTLKMFRLYVLRAFF